MPFDVDIPGAPAWDQGAGDGLAAASAEALRVLEGQWRLLVNAFFACNWVGGDRQAFNDRYTALKTEVERLQAELAGVPGRVADAAGEAHEVRQGLAWRLSPGLGAVWDVLDRVVG
jgi:hypothetical protein